MKKILSILTAILAVLFVLPVQAADDKEALQLARDIIKITKADAGFDNPDPAVERMITAANALLPEDMQAEADKLMKEVREMMQEEGKAFKEKLPSIYAKTYTVEELKGLKAFYESPTGRAFIEKQRQITQELMPLAMEIRQKVMAKIQEKVKDLK